MWLSPRWHVDRFQHIRFLSTSGQLSRVPVPICGPPIIFLSDKPFGQVGHSFTALLLLNTFSLLPDVINDHSMVSTKQSAGFFSIRTEPRRIFNSDLSPISCKQNALWVIIIPIIENKFSLPVNASFRIRRMQNHELNYCLVWCGDLETVCPRI